MRGVYPGTVLCRGVETEVAGLVAAAERMDEEDLGEFRAVVEVCGADVGVYLFEGGECDGGGTGAVEVAGLEDDAGVGGAL